MKFSVVGRNRSAVKNLITDLKTVGFNLAKKPEVVFSVGGDGTYLYAEKEYPGVPKILIRDSSICNKCVEEMKEDVVRKLKSKQYIIKSYTKIEAIIKKKRYTAANDMVVRNLYPIHAIRFLLKINNKIIGKEIIGDGIVVSSPFGSSGYFNSITRKKFERGIGLAFNNVVQSFPHKILPDNAIIYLKLIRGDAIASIDNHTMVKMKTGDSIIIKKSSQMARIIHFNHLKHLNYSRDRFLVLKKKSL